MFIPGNISSISRKYSISGTEKADAGNLVEALESYNKAVESDPGNPVVYFNRATVKADLGDTNGAREDFISFDKLYKLLLPISLN